MLTGDNEFGGPRRDNGLHAFINIIVSDSTKFIGGGFSRIRIGFSSIADNVIVIVEEMVILVGSS